jgi:hypothetical protein
MCGFAQPYAKITMMKVGYLLCHPCHPATYGKHRAPRNVPTSF